MNKIRQLFWNIGMIPNRGTVLLVGIGLIGCLSMIIFGALFAITHDTLFKGLLLLALVPASILMLGSTKLAESWLFASREKRARLEKERMLILLRDWLRANEAEKDDTRRP